MKGVTAVNVGDEWIYRLRDNEPSERVRIVAIEQRKNRIRAEVEFLDGDKCGTQDNVPGVRLRGPWATVDDYDRLMSNCQRLRDDANLTDTEESAISEVFDRIVPEDIATCEWDPVKYAVTVHDPSRFESVFDVQLTEIMSSGEWFERDGTTLLSPAAALICAELACHQNPVPILDWIIGEEKEIRGRCKRGRQFQAYDNPGETRTSDPEWEYQSYLRHHKALHELLRQWCGHRAVTFQERLTAAESEVLRLDILVARLIDIVKERNEMLADVLERQHDEERITAYTVRPVPDRPLKPSEIPVRYIETRRKRWW